MRVLLGCLAICGALGLTGCLLLAQDSPTTDTPGTTTDFDDQDTGIRLHLVPLQGGFLESTFGRDLEKMRSSATYKAAVKFGIDPLEDLTGYVITRRQRTSWFYMFHNTVRSEPECPYFVQRIHKRIADYPSLEGDPLLTDHYLVEAIKNHGGQTKRPDQHYASYSLGRYKRRVIEKRIEIGEVTPSEGTNGPAPWPYEDRLLAYTIGDYENSREAFDQVDFRRSVTWTIRVDFDVTGKSSLHVPELGIDIARRVPPLPRAGLALDQFPEYAKLTPGKGMNLLLLGLSEDEVLRLLGAPLRVSTTGGTRYLHYRPGLVLMFGASSRLFAISVRDEFPGKTAEGISLGDERTAVTKVYGKPSEEGDDFQRFDGLRVEYDAKGKVKALSVLLQQRKPAEDEPP